MYALFGDVQKAYDEVCHERLFSLLLEHGCCGRWWFLVRALYQGATRRVRCGGVMSSPWEVQAGVMQGSVLSPLLFILYINVLATSLEGQGLGVTVAGRQTCVVLYADDVVLRMATGCSSAIGSFLDPVSAEGDISQVVWVFCWRSVSDGALRTKSARVLSLFPCTRE